MADRERKDETEREEIARLQNTQKDPRVKRAFSIAGIAVLVLLGLLYWWVSQG